MTLITRFKHSLENKTGEWLGIILLIGLASALFYAFYFKIQPSVDARAYDSIAWDIAQGKGYDTDSAIGRPGPGYEYFLAGIFSIFGHRYPAIWIFQAILIAGSAYLTFQTTRRVFGQVWHPIIGLAAAALVSWSPDLITSASMLMTEVLTVFLTTATIWGFLKYLSTERRQGIVLTAVVLGLAVLTRSNTILLILPLGGALIYRREWKRGLLLVLVFMAVLAPWALRNYRVYGEPLPFNGAAGLLYVGNHSGSSGELDLHYDLPVGYGDFTTMTQFENDQALRRAGLDYIKSHPLDFIRLSLQRISVYFSFARPFAFWPHLVGNARKVSIGLSSFYAAVIFIGGGLGTLLGLLKGILPNRQHMAVLGAAILSLPLAIAPLIVETRYRFPNYPLLAIGAGFMIHALFTHRDWLGKLAKQLWIGLVLIGGNTIYDVARNFGRIVIRLKNPS